MTTWCFKTTALKDRNSSRELWYWIADTRSSVLLTASKLFVSIEECVADARRFGFRGSPDISARVAHPAEIVCHSDDDAGTQLNAGRTMGPGAAWAGS